jgi:cob(I)alamin adenosyltransferase
VDELDSALGVAAAAGASKPLKEAIRTLQRELYALMADLATPASGGRTVRRMGEKDTQALEARIDALEAELPPLKHFIAAGGTPAAAHLQLARAIARRAERSTWAAHEGMGGLNPEVLVFLNRVSDYLFLLARKANRDAGEPDEILKPVE